MHDFASCKAAHDISCAHARSSSHQHATHSSQPLHYAVCAPTGHTYRTIEHVFQGTKIALVDPATALQFTLDSGHPIGAGDGHTAQQHRMLVTLPPHKLEEWACMRDAVQLQAARSKYAACELARQVLLATGDAQLWHAVPRGQPERFRHLEVLRGELRAAGGDPAALVATGC